jgi:hypothetical protein
VLSFTQSGPYQVVKSAIPIPSCTSFRYFEVEVLEITEGTDIIFGIIEENEQFQSQQADKKQMHRANT